MSLLTSEGRVSRREAKKARTRAAIIEAARALFAEKGFEATRTRDIAERAGIATGTLFNYAPTKEDVVLMVWKVRATELADSGLAAAQAADDPVDGVVALFGPILAFYAEDLELGRIYLHQATYSDVDDPEMKPVNEVFMARLAAMLVPHAGLKSMHAAINVFSAYYTVLTLMLTGRLPTAEAATGMLRDLVRVQRAGWGA